MVKLTNMENEKMNTNKTYSIKEINKTVDEYTTKKEADFTNKFNACADTIHLLKEELDYTNYLIKKLEDKSEEKRNLMALNIKHGVKHYHKPMMRLKAKNIKISDKITKLQFIADQVKSTLSSLDNVWKKLYIYEEAYEEAIDELS